MAEFESYYPSARVRLIVRFEDWGAPSAGGEAPALPPQLRRGSGKAAGAALRAAQNVDGAWVLLAPGDEPDQVGSPQQQQRSVDDLTHVVEGIIPQSATLKLQGIRTASQLSLALPFAAMPFDPRVVRAVGIQFFLGTVSAEDHARGIAGEMRSDATPSGALPYHVIPDDWTDGDGVLRSNLRFEGWVDNWEDLWDATESPSCNLECTDNTRLLIEQEAPPRLTVDPKTRVDQAVAEYLSNFPQFRGLSVQYLPSISVSEIPKLGDAFGRSAFHPKIGPSPAGGGDSKLKVWDYLTDVCGAIGHNIRMVGTRIIIQRPRTMWDRTLARRADDPWQGRKLEDGTTAANRVWVYGRNVSQMSVKRQYSTVAPKNVEVRSYDPARKFAIVARYPEKKDRIKAVLPGAGSDEMYLVKEIHGIRDAKTARVVAQSIYEAQSRAEILVRIVTASLASLGGGNSDPDALDMIPGDAVEIEILRGPSDRGGSDTVEAISAAMRERPADFLRSLGYGDALSAAYAKCVAKIGYPTTFRIRSLMTSWDVEAGVSLDIEAMNYIEARADVDLDSDGKISANDEATAGASKTGAKASVVSSGKGI